MGYLKIEEIREATAGEVLCAGQPVFRGLSIDSRTIREDELFVALKGDRFDGHDFLSAALVAGAGALVAVRDAKVPAGKTMVLVQDTLRALQDIAYYLRSRMDVPVVGVTGTNGKTTTKELLSSILGKRRKVLKTSGNLNNHIGLPLCLSRMDRDEEVFVLEMGSNRRGDIKELCDIALPDHAVVTNVGPAHLEGFGSLEAVRDTDLEILSYVKVAAVNSDDRFLLRGVKAFSGGLITYGIEHPADVRAEGIVLGEGGSSFLLRLPDGQETMVNLSIAGRFNVYNALGAAAIAQAAGAGIQEIREGLESFEGVPLRLRIYQDAGALVISDVYNANPASMEQALRELVRLRRGRAVAVLGDMLELGAYAAQEHRGLVALLSEMGIEVLIAVGREMGNAAEGYAGAVHRAEDACAAREILAAVRREGDTILVKGSRGMRMERVLEDKGCPVATEAGHAL